VLVPGHRRPLINLSPVTKVSLYDGRVPRFRVEWPRNAWDVVRSLPAFASPVFIALKLAGVITWSWWWVLSPLWLGGLALALMVGGLIIVWCLGQWAHLVVDQLRWRRRRA
jgi:hypothetical protein